MKQVANLRSRWPLTCQAYLQCGRLSGARYQKEAGIKFSDECSYCFLHVFSFNREGGGFIWGRNVGELLPEHTASQLIFVFCALNAVRTWSPVYERCLASQQSILIAIVQ
jgi:hypothetical protein